MRPQVRPLITSVATFAALLCIASCSKDVATQPGSAIQQSYEMEYEVARNRTTGRASFRANDSSSAQVQLAPPAAILYNAIPMSWNNAEPFGYSRLQPGRLESGIFEYTDASGTVRTNVATLSSVETIALPASVNELIMSSQADIVWQGAAVGSGETVSLIFNTPANGLATFFQQAPSATSITLTPADLAQLGAGTATWRLERVRYIDLQANTSAGGRIGIRWSTGDRPITIK